MLKNEEIFVLTCWTLYGGIFLEGSGLNAGTSTSFCLSMPFLPTPLWLERLSDLIPFATGIKAGGAFDNDLLVEFYKKKFEIFL